MFCLLRKFLVSTIAVVFLVSCGSDDDGGDPPDIGIIPNDGVGTMPEDNCPGIDNPDQLDTDSDGLGDACDNDDDADGFNDADDPEPLNSEVPGNFGSVDEILNDPFVTAALAQVSAAGFDILTERGLTPPNLTGFYFIPDSGGVFTATSDGSNVGRSRVGQESRIDQEENSITSADVFFTRGSPVSFSVAEGSIIRGMGNTYTIYSRRKGTCTEANSDFSTLGITIASATITDAGNIVDQSSLSITVDTQGELTTACEDRIAGLGEIPGNWNLSEFAEAIRSEPTDFQFMCVDSTGAYAPTEDWQNEMGEACSCGEDYVLSCQ